MRHVVHHQRLIQRDCSRRAAILFRNKCDDSTRDGGSPLKPVRRFFITATNANAIADVKTPAKAVDHLGENGDRHDDRSRDEKHPCTYQLGNLVFLHT